MPTIIDYIKSIDKAVWQDVFLSAIFIPIAIYVFKTIGNWITIKRPGNLLLKGFRKQGDVLIFLSQLFGTSNNTDVNRDQKFIAFYPNPLPNNKNNQGTRHYINVNPVWSESDGRCATDIFNLLGRVDKTDNVKIAETIKDWDRREVPIFSIGFNPKTHDLITECSPINFSGLDRDVLKIDGHSIELNSRMPYDAGIIQKTFLRDRNIPVFILAGHGMMGTELSGYFLKENFIILGKLYGDKPFCILLKTDVTKGKTYHEVKGIYPKPSSLYAGSVRFERGVLGLANAIKYFFGELKKKKLTNEEAFFLVERLSNISSKIQWQRIELLLTKSSLIMDKDKLKDVYRRQMAKGLLIKDNSLFNV